VLVEPAEVFNVFLGLKSTGLEDKYLNRAIQQLRRDSEPTSSCPGDYKVNLWKAACLAEIKNHPTGIFGTIAGRT
jgi:hypothetical protein